MSCRSTAVGQPIAARHLPDRSSAPVYVTLRGLVEAPDRLRLHTALDRPGGSLSIVRRCQPPGGPSAAVWWSMVSTSVSNTCAVNGFSITVTPWSGVFAASRTPLVYPDM